MPEIQDFTDSRRWVIETTFKERYDREVEYSLGDADNRPAPSDRELSVCPVLFMRDGRLPFRDLQDRRPPVPLPVLIPGYQQYGTGMFECDDLTEFVVSLHQAQADLVA